MKEPKIIIGSRGISGIMEEAHGLIEDAMEHCACCDRNCSVEWRLIDPDNFFWCVDCVKLPDEMKKAIKALARQM
jgi:hypothetical protein